MYKYHGNTKPVKPQPPVEPRKPMEKTRLTEIVINVIGDHTIDHFEKLAVKELKSPAYPNSVIEGEFKITRLVGHTSYHNQNPSQAILQGGAVTFDNVNFKKDCKAFETQSKLYPAKLEKYKKDLATYEEWEEKDKKEKIEKAKKKLEKAQKELEKLQS